MKLNNIPHVRAAAIDTALTNFFARNDLRPIALGKRRLANLTRSLEHSNKTIAEINEGRRRAGWNYIIAPYSPEDQSLSLEWLTLDGGVSIKTNLWTSLSLIETKALPPMSRNAALYAYSFKIRIYKAVGGCSYFLWRF